MSTKGSENVHNTRGLWDFMSPDRQTLISDFTYLIIDILSASPRLAGLKSRTSIKHEMSLLNQGWVLNINVT